jgi:uncharacterized iron-regulated membrane protein
MTDRELWVKTCKTVGAMVGGTVVFLGSMSLVLVLMVGRQASATANVEATPAAAPSPAVVKAPTLPTGPKIPRRGIAASARAGESI